MDITRINAEIARLSATSYSAQWMSQVLSDLNGIGDPGDVHKAADFYGDSNKVARLAQLMFTRTVTQRYPEMTDEVLQGMDHLRDFASDTDMARREELQLTGGNDSGA